MAISIWDKPAELKLTPLPFEMLMKAGIMKEQQYAEGEALQGTIEDELAKIGSIDIDTPIRNAELQKYQEGVRSIVDQNKGDYGSMAAQFKQLQKDFNYNKNYGVLSGVLNRYNSRVESLKEKQEAHKEYVKSNGKGGMSYEDVLAAQAWEDAHQAELVKDPTLGTWTGYTKEGARNTVNMNEKAAEASKLITPQVYADAIANAGLVPTSYGMLRYGNGTREISPAAFREELIAKYLKTDLEVQNYLGFSNRVKGVNDKINQTIPQYVGNADNNFTGIDLESGLPVMRNLDGVKEAADKITDMLYYDPIYKSAKSTGQLTQVYKEDPNVSYVQNWELKEARAAAREDQLRAPVPAQTSSTVFSAYTNRTNPLSEIDFSRVSFDPNGNISVNFDVETGSTSLMAQARGGGEETEPEKALRNAKAREKAQAQAKALTSTVANARAANPSLAGKSNQEVLNFVKTAFENGSSSFNGYTFPGMNLKDAAGFIVKDLPNQTLWVNNSAGKVNGKSDLKDMADKVGGTPTELAEVIKKKIEGGEADFVPVNASGKAGWRVQLGTANGENYEVIIPASNEAQSMFAPYSVAMDAYRSGKIGLDETKKVNPSDKGVLTRLQSDAEGNPQWTVGRVLTLADTKANLDYNKITSIQDAKVRFGGAVDFLPTGEMVIYDIPDLINQNVNTYSNTYLRPYVPNDQGKNYQYNSSDTE